MGLGRAPPPCRWMPSSLGRVDWCLALQPRTWWWHLCAPHWRMSSWHASLPSSTAWGSPPWCMSLWPGALCPHHQRHGSLRRALHRQRRRLMASSLQYQLPHHHRPHHHHHRRLGRLLPLPARRLRPHPPPGRPRPSLLPQRRVGQARPPAHSSQRRQPLPCVVCRPGGLLLVLRALAAQRPAVAPRGTAFRASSPVCRAPPGC